MLNLSYKANVIRVALFISLFAVAVTSCFTPYFEVWDYDIELSYTILDSNTVKIEIEDHIGYQSDLNIEKAKGEGPYEVVGTYTPLTRSIRDTITLDSTYKYRCYTMKNDTTIVYSNTLNVTVLRDYFKTMTLYGEVLDSGQIKLSWDENFEHPASFKIQAHYVLTGYWQIKTLSSQNNEYIHKTASPYLPISYRILPVINGRSLPYTNQVSFEPRKTFDLDELNFDMVYVEGDTFVMGNLWGNGGPDESPTHRVWVKDFYMGTHEITQEQYSAVTMRSSNFPGYKPHHPAGCIDFFLAVEFCNHLSTKAGFEKVYKIENTNTGKIVSWDSSKNGYRLPTEAEWEYAARSRGREDRNYVGTNSHDEIDQYSWYRFNSNDDTHEVGTKSPTVLGFYDMGGNVSEWCWDSYSSSYYAELPFDNPNGPNVTDTDKRTLRGGSYKNSIYHTSSRIPGNVTNKTTEYGFRICRNAE